MATKDFPQKTFEIPFKNDPRPDLYKDLNDVNVKYPIADIADSPTYLPDFPNAVELEGSVYRVNVPGYFFKCPGNKAGVMASDTESAIIIDRFNHRMNAVGNHSHRHTWVDKKITLNNGGTIDGKTEGIVDGQENYDIGDDYGKNHEEYVEKNFAAYLSYVEDAAYNGKYVGDISINKKIYKPSSWSYFSPTVTLGASTCHVAILSNQREYPQYYPGSNDLIQRDLGLDYIVCSGLNSCCGMANSLIPIIPGVATTSKPSGIEYESMWDATAGSTMSIWSVDALSEVTMATISRVIKMTNFFCQEKENIGVTGVLEAKGTYVYAYKGSGCTDKFFFVPCKSVDQTVNPVTKIRDITNSYSCTPNLPAKNRTFDTMMTSSTIVHKQEKKVEVVIGEQIAMDGFKATIDGSNLFYPYSNVECHPKMRAHTSALDGPFQDIFANPSITGHREKFVAQKLTLQAWPGTCSHNISDINGHAEHAVFNPVKGG